MKRPSGLWILLSLGVLWITVQDVYAVRATALIFGRSTSTTTTESAENSSASSEASGANETSSVAVTEPSTAPSEGNTTKPTLTGNPQIDYKWDPNLPSALKGYDLSDYPFYERVPDLEGLEFKCDGLHDGFYASIPHKCQVYHHCLFGTRYDFLCANYTAFDQKTFICQFVSIVDCENSKKYWHRNDDLYQAATTTTQKPLRSIYTPPPETGDGPLTPLPSAPGGDGRRPSGGRRPYRPQRRRPPQMDYYEDEYYDDYYEERPRSRRKRPRPRPRPVYEDDYEEYEDERYEGRRAQGRRRPYRADRDRRRNKGRKKPEYDEDEEVEELFEDDDFVEAAKKQKPNEDRRKPTDEEHPPESRERKRSKDKRRRPEDDPEPETPRKPARKGNRRPVEEEYVDELPQSDDSRSYEDQRPRKKKPQSTEEDKDGRPVIKPVSGSIYDRPRLAPRINLPVPKNAADKFSYKPLGQGTTTKKPLKNEKEEEEYYDDYEEELPPKRKKNQRNRPDDIKKEKPRNENSRNQPTSTTKKVKQPESEEKSEEKVERTTLKPKYGGGRKYTTTTRASTTQSNKRKPSSEEYEDEDYEVESKEVKEVTRPVSPFRSRNKSRERPTTTSSTTSTTSTTTTTTTTTTTEAPQKEVMVRIVKRPFLPSRGGNPYSARGLQPIGTKAIDRPTTAIVEYQEPSAEDTRALQEVPIVKEVKQVFKPSPVLIKIPVRTKYIPPSAEAQEVFDSESSRQQNYKSQEYLTPRPTQKPQRIPERNPLDTNEYDVTLNDALNPTLPNIPIRTFPTGFSNTANDFTYSTYQRPRYVQVEPAISQSNPELVYQAQAVRQQQPQRYEQFPANQYTTINGGYRRREAPNGQTQALYSSF